MSSPEKELNDLFFPVEFQPIYLRKNELESEKKQQGLFPEDPYREIDKYKAIVDCERDCVFKIVSQSYKIIKNKDAYEIGKRAYARLFPDIEEEEYGDHFEVLKVTAPKTRSYCHIDLVHDTFELEGVPGENDVYKPYLRITNSYNSTHALKYRIGFVRWACRNGVVFDEEVVNVNLPHTKQKLKAEDLAKTVELEADVEELRELETQFVSYLGELHDYKIPKLYASSVASRALNLRFDVNAEDEKRKMSQREKAKAFDRAIQRLVDRYYKKMGPHAYALFNVITDYATHAERHVVDSERNMNRLNIDTYQRRAGRWIRSFCDRYRDRHFGLDSYVEEELEMFDVVRRGS